MKTNLHVVKIGGSLLTRGDFVAAVRGWAKETLAASPPSHLLMLVGGGRLVDALRELDGQQPIETEVSHWAAIDLMEVTARLVASWLPEWSTATTLDQVARRPPGGVSLLLPADFLKKVEPHLPGCPLPVGWEVTSDSIAARLAEVLGARKLTLLKSRPPWDGATGHDSLAPGDLVELASTGYVDPHFPLAASALREVSAEWLPPAGDLGQRGEG